MNVISRKRRGLTPPTSNKLRSNFLQRVKNRIHLWGEGQDFFVMYVTEEKCLETSVQLLNSTRSKAYMLTISTAEFYAACQMEDAIDNLIYAKNLPTYGSSVHQVKHLVPKEYKVPKGFFSCGGSYAVKKGFMLVDYQIVLQKGNIETVDIIETVNQFREADYKSTMQSVFDVVNYDACKDPLGMLTARY